VPLGRYVGRVSADRALRSVVLAVACLALAVPASATAAGTVGRTEATLIFGGSGEADSLAVEYDVPPVNGVSVPSYVFGGQPNTSLDGSVTPGSGCKRLRSKVACPADGVTDIGIYMYGGDDFVNVGSGTQIPAATSVHGSLGNDHVFADENAPSAALRPLPVAAPGTTNSMRELRSVQTRSSPDPAATASTCTTARRAIRTS